LLRALEQVNQQIKTGAIYVPPTLDSTNHS
jgi:hypothetical protein